MSSFTTKTAVRHFGFVLAQFWISHDVSLDGIHFPFNDIMMRSDTTEMLQFHDIAHFWKMLIRANYRQFLGIVTPKFCDVIV